MPHTRHRNARRLTLLAAASLLAGQTVAAELSDGVYRIPYANGTDVYVGQDHVQHSTDSNIAVDMNGRNGSDYTVVAAADGWIRFVEEDYSAQLDCDGVASSQKKNNYVWIEHANGEWTKYSHMTQGSFTNAGRKLNEFVTAGTPLGKEGAVGCANGRHLHFEVGTPRETSPITTIGGYLNDNDGSKRNRIPRICGIATAYFADNTQYEARAVPGAVVAGSAEFSKRNIKAEDYQCQVDQAVLAGYQLEYADGFNSGGNTYFNAVFKPQGNYLWASFHHLSVAGYQARYGEYTDKGFRLSHLESYHTAAGPRYLAIFTKAPGPQTTAYIDYSVANHQNVRDALLGTGYRPRNVSVLSVDGQLRYSVMYQQVDLGAWQMKSTMTSGEYQVAMEANKAEGRFPIYVNAYIHNGQPLFSAVWSSKALGLFKARHDLSSAQYHNEWDSAMDLGMTTRSVAGYVDDGVWQYAGIWRRNP